MEELVAALVKVHPFGPSRGVLKETLKEYWSLPGGGAYMGAGENNLVRRRGCCSLKGGASFYFI